MLCTASACPGRNSSKPNTSRAARSIRLPAAMGTLGSQPVTTIRPIEPADTDLVRTFYADLSDRSRRLRYLVPAAELSDEDLAYFTDVDHRRHEAVIALDETGRMIGVARYVRTPGQRESAEVAVVVADDRQSEGIG